MSLGLVFRTEGLLIAIAQNPGMETLSGDVGRGPCKGPQEQTVDYPGMVIHTCNLNTRWQRQEDQK